MPYYPLSQITSNLYTNGLKYTTDLNNPSNVNIVPQFDDLNNKESFINKKLQEFSDIFNDCAINPFDAREKLITQLDKMGVNLPRINLSDVNQNVKGGIVNYSEIENLND